VAHMSFFPDVEPPTRPPRLRSSVPRWLEPPSNELAVPVAIVVVLARRPGVALCLRRIDVYREGWRFALSVRAARVDTMTDDEWFDVLELVQQRSPRRRNLGVDGLRLGIEFPDGSKVIGNEARHPAAITASDPDTPLLTFRHSGGGGNDDEYDLGMHAWLWPAPAPERGPCRLVCDWRALNIPEQSLVIETNELVAAREHVVDVWGDSRTPLDVPNLARQLFELASANEQVAHRIRASDNVAETRSAIRVLAREKGIRIRTAVMGDVLVVVRADAAVWSESTQTMRAKLTPSP